MLKRNLSRFFQLFFVMLLFLNNTIIISAQELPEVKAEAFVLMEAETGKLLHAQNEEARMYPASLTKILTALICIEYIQPDEIVIAGNEIYSVPADSSKAGHQVGEAITGENLIRGLIIPSGNETACIVALEVAKRYTGETTLSYSKAEQIFSQLMNEKAEELGATGSNFTNPHGYHDDNHYTTAHDMALIAREALNSELIMEISGETEYNGMSAGDSADASLLSVQHNWKSHNELIMTGNYYYQYATGLKTGFTSLAGNCLAATATKNGVSMISITLNSPTNEDGTETRWDDAVNLFEYGFNNFATRTVQAQGAILGEVEIADPQLGAETMLSYVAAETIEDFLSEEQLESLELRVEIDSSLLVTVEREDGSSFSGLTSPITKDQVIGKAIYLQDGEPLYTGEVLAADDVLERTFNSDVDYYVAYVKAAVFSVKAIPFWIIGFVIIILIILLIIKIRNKRRRNRFTLRKRY